MSFSDMRQCRGCKHFVQDDGLHCAAFPDVIPIKILDGLHDHRQPWPGDHGVRWEPKDPKKQKTPFDPIDDWARA